MSWSLVSFALLEFAKAFWPARTGAAGARDFLWVSMFVTFSALFAYFSYSVIRSGGARFEQVLLGALPEHGIPIHLGVTFERRGGLDAAMVEQFRKQFPHLTLAPARDFTLDEGRLVLPGLSADNPATSEDDRGDSGDGTKGVDAKASVRPQTLAMALPIDSPLWLRIAAQTPIGPQGGGKFPMVVAASRSVFKKQQVDYAAYRTAVLKGAPFGCSLEHVLPKDFPGWDKLSHLVLRVREGIDRQTGRDRLVYHPFRVIWVDSFPLPEQIALVAPLSTYDLIEAAVQRPAAALHLEGEGQSTARTSRVSLTQVDIETSGIAEFQAFAACLGAAKPAQRQKGVVEVWSIGPSCGTPAQPPRSSNPRVCLSPPCPDEGGFNPTPEASPSPADSEDWSIITLQVNLNPPLPMTRIDACARTSRLLEKSAASDGTTRFQREDATHSMKFAWLGVGRIGAPCAALSSSDDDRDRRTAERMRDEKAGNRGRSDEPLRLANEKCRGDATDQTGVLFLDGYRHVVVYVPPSRSATVPVGTTTSAATLDGEVAKLLAWQLDGKPVLRLAPTYEMALVRYGVLSTLMNTVSLPLGIGLAMLYIWLSGTILATAIGHRRPQYGLLMTYGATTWGLTLVILAQIVLAAVIGGVVGYFMSAVVVDLVNGLMSRSAAVDAARDTIGLDTGAFLSNLSVMDSIEVWLLLTGLTVLVGIFILLVSRIATAKAPIELLKLG